LAFEHCSSSSCRGRRQRPAFRRFIRTSRQDASAPRGGPPSQRDPPLE
jgi:hypothetical protein